MSKQLMIIITGAPGTGKTTLSKSLAEKLNIPVINKDEIKELLFDNLGIKDNEWQLKLGITSFNLLYFFVEKLIQAGKPFIVEGNFDNTYSTAYFNDIRSKHNFQLVQIYCHTEYRVLYDRFVARDKSGTRHPGHIRLGWAAEFEDFQKHISERKFVPLDINQNGDVLIDIDTTSFEDVNFKKIYEEIKEIMVQKNRPCVPLACVPFVKPKKGE
jgi:predicted kinase